jgi:nucleotide-binding universal stress UspA family protein
MRTRAIVVGTDGTETSTAAVDWAAQEARRRRVPLRIVHAYEWDWHESRYDIGNEYIDVARELAEAATAAAARQARDAAPGITIEAYALAGHAGAQLLQTAKDAELLVVGNRGRGGFAGLLLGSVSQRVATHAACPVVVVRGHHDTSSGPVVAGVDDSPAADHVLETAFDAAAARGCGLLAVRAYLPAIPLWLTGVSAAEVDTPDQDAAERVRLDEQLVPWQAKYPDVPVGVLLTHDSAAAALVAASHDAQLLVVGSRGHGVVAGTLLGSAGLQLLHHADCPVYLTRPS